MAPELWDRPYGSIDETTAKRERLRAEERVESAITGEARTLEAVSLLRAAISQIADMHEANHYTEALLPIFRGTRRHAT